MSIEIKRRLQMICRSCTTVLIFIIAVMLIVSCVRIYQSGDRPFTREVIAQAASRIAIPGYLCLLSMIAGFLFSETAPKRKPDRNLRCHLLRLKCKAQYGDPQQQKAIRSQRRLRIYYRVGTGFLATCLLVYPVIYFTDPSHFSISDLTRDILRAVTVSMAPAGLALLLVYICSVLEDFSIQREIEILKNIDNKEKINTERLENKMVRPALRCAIFVIAVAFILLGIDNGGIGAVLGKAIRICTECIGLG